MKMEEFKQDGYSISVKRVKEVYCRDILDYDIEYTKMDGHVVREFQVGEPMKIKGEVNESILVDGHKIEVIDIGNHYSKDWEENFDEFGQWAFDSLEEVLDMIDDDSDFITFLELSALVKSEREEGNYFIVTFDFFESGE